MDMTGGQTSLLQPTDHAIHEGGGPTHERIEMLGVGPQETSNRDGVEEGFVLLSATYHIHHPGSSSCGNCIEFSVEGQL